MKRKFLSLFMILIMSVPFVSIMPAAADDEMTAAKLQIGDYVQMGSYYGDPVLWRCVDIDDNGPLMLSDKILCLKPYDVQGENESGSHARYEGRKEAASSYWKDSNIRCWLNSDAEAGAVEWLCGNPPSAENTEYNAYDYEAGFLNQFTELEKNAIKPVEQKSLLSNADKDVPGASGSELHLYNEEIYSVKSENGVNKLVYQNILENYDTAYTEQVEDKVFLLDVKQIQRVFDQTPKLGLWYHIGKLTEKAVENSDYKDSLIRAGADWYSWLRSPVAYMNGQGEFDSTTRGVARSGKIISNISNSESIGVRPAFYMQDQTKLLSGSGTDSDPYLLTAGHAHDLSVECGDSAPVAFAKKLTSDADGRLLINGTELSPEQSGSKSYYSLPAGDYYLEADVSLNHKIEIKTGDVRLCLNGHTLNLNGNYIEIAREVSDTGDFSVCDCGGEGQILSDYHDAYVNAGLIFAAGGKFRLYGGKVRNSCASPGENANAIAAVGDAVYLYGGAVISDQDYAVRIDSQGGALFLSGAPELKGREKDIYLPNEYSEEIITLAGTLTADLPYRVDAEAARTFTAGWGVHMSGKSFSDFFVSAKKGLFINENENGELAFYDYAITEQPTPENSYTVTANGAPDYVPSSYQWYPAEVTVQAVTDRNASVCDGKDTSSYDVETGWTGTDSGGGFSYFKMNLSKGDILAVKTSRNIESGQVMLVSEDYRYQSYTNVANADGEYILTAKENGTYCLRIDAYKDTPVTLTAKLTSVNLGSALAGQTGRSLLAENEDDYLCRVSYADGTVLDSDIVHFVPQHTHSLTEVRAKAATCTEEGNKTYYTCTCNKWFADKEAAEEIIDKTSVVLAAKGHEYDTAWQSDSENHWHMCKNCSMKSDNAPHSWDNGEVITPPAADTEGEKRLICTVCKKTKTEKIPVPGHVHSTVLHERKEATCTEDGNRAYYTCTGCNKWFADAAAGEEITDKSSVVLAAEGHNMSAVQAKAATCTEDGNNGYYHCAVCNKDFKDEAGNTLTTAADEKMAAKGHIYDNTWQSDDKNHWHTCRNCSTKSDNAPHSWDSGEVVTPPTAETEGEKRFTCTVCRKTKTEKISLTEHVHSTVLHERKEATCTEDGNKDYYTCTGCDKWFADEAAGEEITDKSSVLIAAKGHVTGDDWKFDNEMHWKECKAKGCGAKLDEVSHELVWITDKEATETEKGLKHQECKVCGFTKAAVEIPASGNGEGPDSGTIVKDVQNGENTPKTELKTPLSELIKAILTDEEQKQVENGVQIKILLTVEDAGNSVSEEDKKAVTEVLNAHSGYRHGQYLDVNLLKIIGTSQEKITNTEELITVTFEVPRNLRGAGRKYAVIRIHNGSSTLLEDIDSDENTVTIRTDKFSTYALVYSEKTDDSQTGGDDNNGNIEDDNQNTGDSTSDGNQNNSGAKDRMKSANQDINKTGRQIPGTRDNSGRTRWMAALFMSIFGICGAAVCRKKKKPNR